MKSKLMDIICVIGFIVMIVMCGILVATLVKPDGRMYVFKYIAPETHTCYLITNNGICPIYNADGSLYVEE